MSVISDAFTSSYVPKTNRPIDQVIKAMKLLVGKEPNAVVRNYYMGQLNKLWIPYSWEELVSTMISQPDYRPLSHDVRENCRLLITGVSSYQWILDHCQEAPAPESVSIYVAAAREAWKEYDLNPRLNRMCVTQGCDHIAEYEPLKRDGQSGFVNTHEVLFTRCKDCASRDYPVKPWIGPPPKGLISVVFIDKSEYELYVVDLDKIPDTGCYYLSLLKNVPGSSKVEIRTITERYGVATEEQDGHHEQKTIGTYVIAYWN